MASRQPFLKRDPWAARPKPAPGSGPKPATRRPPTRDPRAHPWRPKPPKIPMTPQGPLFPGAPKPKNPVFGKRPPMPFPATLPGKLKPLIPLLRLHPLINFGLWAWTGYELWQWWQQQGLPATPNGGYLHCQGPRPPRRVKYGWARFSICATYQPPPPNDYDVIPPRPKGVSGNWLIQWEQSGIAPKYSTTRFDTVQQWYYGNTVPVGGVPNPFPEPDIPFVVLPPEENPYPYPFAPPPYPATPPLTRPRDEPYPQPDPYPRPQPSPRPAPTPSPAPGAVAPIPAIEWGTDSGIKPGWHEQRPPREDEREKKKRLKPGVGTQWLFLLKQGVGKYTEIDDTLSALYKGLPWHLRRWRGRDGVWRDRDITSVDRAKRLYQLLGELDVNKAIEEVIKQELTDLAFGTAGNILKKRAKELGDEGLWTGNTGFQTGGSLRQDNWDEVYEKLKKEAAKKQKLRQYTVKEMSPDGTYRLVRKTRPVTQIPWFKQESYYPRMARPGMAEWWELTAAEKAARKKNVKAYYYAPTRTHRNLYLDEE